MRDNYRQCSASIDREVAHPIRSTNTVESDLCVEVWHDFSSTNSKYMEKNY